MNPEDLEKITNTMPEHIIERISLLYQIEPEDYPYDLRKFKNELIRDVEDEDEEDDINLPTEEKKYKKVVSVKQFAFEQEWMQKEINNDEIFVEKEYLPPIKSKKQYPTSVGIEGDIYENVALIKVNEKIHGFVRYFTSDFLPAVGIEKVFEKYDTLAEVVNHYKQLEEKKDPFFLDTKEIAKQVIEESNINKNIIYYEELNYQVIKNVCLSKDAVTRIEIVNKENE